VLQPRFSGADVRRTTCAAWLAREARTDLHIAKGFVDKEKPDATGWSRDGFGRPINKSQQQRAVMEENEIRFGPHMLGRTPAPGLTPSPTAQLIKAKPAS